MESFPKKIIGAYALLFNDKNQVLLVKNVDDIWILPGGMVEDGESPKEGCAREVKEEINLGVQLGEPLFIGHRKSTLNRGEMIWMVLDGGVLDEQQIDNIQLQAKELVEFRFVDTEKIPSMVIDEFREWAKIIEKALLLRKFVYSESE